MIITIEIVIMVILVLVVVDSVGIMSTLDGALGHKGARIVKTLKLKL